MIIAVLVAALLLGVTWAVLRRKVFVVRYIDVIVQGDNGADDYAQRARELSGIRLGDSIFDANRQNVEVALRADGELKLTGFAITMPDRVTMSIAVGKPVLAIRHMGYNYTLDSTLHVIDCAQSADISGLPLVTGIEMQQTPIGTRLNVQPLDAEALASVAEALKDTGMVDSVEYVNMSNTLDISALTRNGWKLVLGDARDMQHKLTWAGQLSAQLESEGKTGGTIDVSTATHAYYAPPAETAVPQYEATQLPDDYEFVTFPPN